MLQRVGPDLFEARTGETIQVIAIASSNGGVEAAQFRYGPAMLPATPVLNHPGCSFVVNTPVTMFGCVVVFATGVSGARYDLFEVDANGTQTDLQESVNPGAGPLVQFRVRGVAVPVLAGVADSGTAAARRAAPPPPSPPPPPPPKAAKKKAAKKKTAKKKTAAKKPGKGKPAKKKTGGTARKRKRGAR